MKTVQPEIVKERIESELQNLHTALRALNLARMDYRQVLVMSRLAVGTCAVAVYGGDKVNDIELSYDHVMSAMTNGSVGYIVITAPEYAYPVQALVTLTKEDVARAAQAASDKKVQRARRYLDRVEEQVAHYLYQQSGGQ